MSTPNPTHIIAEHRVDSMFWPAMHDDEVREDCARDLYAEWCDCLCGETLPLSEHGEHVVSKLTDAGYSIVHHRATCSESGDNCKHLPGCVVAVCICGDDWPCPIFAAAAEGEKP